MPLQDLLRTPLVLVPPTDTPDGQGGYVRQTVGVGTEQRVMGRIEPRQSNTRRLVADQGDVPITGYVAYLMAHQYDEAGSPTTPVHLAANWRIRTPDATTYVVVGDPLDAQDRFGPHHIEAQLERVGGGV
jgi:hypothetical protein